MHDGAKTYPGDVATADQIQRLADEYRGAAHDLLARGKRRQPATWAPARLSAIHAIEFYLNALLLHKGQRASEIRGLQHDLAKRAELAASTGLRLRKRTLLHLNDLSHSREYLVTRYGAELAGSWTQLNRLMAALEEIATKVALALVSKSATSPAAAKAG